MIDSYKQKALLYSLYFPPQTREKIQAAVNDPEFIERMELLFRADSTLFKKEQLYLSELQYHSQSLHHSKNLLKDIAGIGASKSFFLTMGHFMMEDWLRFVTRIMYFPEDIRNRKNLTWGDEQHIPRRRQISEKTMRELRVWVNEWYPKDDPLKIKESLINDKIR